jgi:hypothetical protein
MKRGTWWSCVLAAVLPFAACSKEDGGNEPDAAPSGGTSGASGAPASGGKVATTGGVPASSGGGGKAPSTGGRSSGGSSGNAPGTGGAGRGGSASGGAAGAEATGGASGGVAGEPGAPSGGTANAGATGEAGKSSSAGAAGESSFEGSVERTWNFDSDSEGWSGQFSDYPEGEEDFYELDFAQAALPAELGDGGGLRLGGDNHSDDLFMYLSYRLDGLKPSASYTLDVEVDIGTNAPTDCGGIGGSPGPSVHFKIGASAREPESSADSQGILRLNLDKGNQATDGADLKRVGDVGNTLVCPDPLYQRKTLELSDFAVTTAADGSLWLLVGTDSGFEGETILYYDKISATLTLSE